MVFLKTILAEAKPKRSELSAEEYSSKVTLLRKQTSKLSCVFSHILLRLREFLLFPQLKNYVICRVSADARTRSPGRHDFYA